MDNFIFENSTEVYFGKDCVKEYLQCILASYGENVMLAYGQGSIKRSGIYAQVRKHVLAAGNIFLIFPASC